MTNQEHPITPPPELVAQWLKGYPGETAYSVATQAAQWGADQELDACCQWLFENDYDVAPVCLRAARRPKPPSLKEQALEELDELLAAVKQLGIFNPPKNIRRALEQLND